MPVQKPRLNASSVCGLRLKTKVLRLVSQEIYTQFPLAFIEAEKDASLFLFIKLSILKF